MSQEIFKKPVFISDENAEENETSSVWQSFMPILSAVGGSIILLIWRLNADGANFISDGALMMLALAAYLLAAVFYLTNLFAPSGIAERLGLWGAALGVFFNLSSWLVRWVSAYDRELDIFVTQGRDLAEMPWMFRYVPFANLYDLSLAFAFGAGIATLFVIRRKHFRTVAALALPLAAIILVLARFIGGEFIDLPPVLDSYWRPIHVGVASLSYGVALVCFAVAVLYLLKDGLKVQWMAIWANIFALAVFTTVSKFSVFAPATFGTYAASTFIGNSRTTLALRADIPYVGWFLVAAAGLLGGAIIGYAVYLSKTNETARSFGNRLMQISLLVQGAGIGLLVYQLKTIRSVAAYLDPAQYERFGVWMMQQQNIPPHQISAMDSVHLNTVAGNWIAQNISQIHLSLQSNPVELSALITAFTGTFFIVLFNFKTARIRAALPPAEILDGLMYKLAGVAFAGLALLLITGAVWANESWGRYWGWDAKEVGALVAWLTYAAFLHSRIARGWKDRRSAYFAIVAFLLVIFTYLGVSYLLPGLHSYA